MRRRPLRSDTKKTCRPFWDTQECSSESSGVLSSLTGASDDANGELTLARAASNRSAVRPCVRRRGREQQRASVREQRGIGVLPGGAERR